MNNRRLQIVIQVYPGKLGDTRNVIVFFKHIKTSSNYVAGSVTFSKFCK